MSGEDFLTSYRSPIVEYDREVYTMMSEKGRIHRKVDIFFGCLFIFAGLLYLLIVQGHATGITVAVGFGLYGLMIITLRASSIWRMQSIDDPNEPKAGYLGQRITYDYFARRCAKNKNARPSTGANCRWADKNTNETSEVNHE